MDAGCLVAVFALWNFLTESGDPWTGILLAAVGAALTMIGPGVWSVDARLFGWSASSFEKVNSTPLTPNRAAGFAIESHSKGTNWLEDRLNLGFQQSSI